MRFTVVWSNTALDKLAKLWVQSANRNAVSLAQSLIDHLLRVDPGTRGKPFFGDRIVVVGPLHVLYTIDVMDMKG